MINNDIGLSHPEFVEIYEIFDKQVEWPYIACGYGWRNIIIECHKVLLQEDPDYKVLQIKEKFGGLRYYFAASNPALSHRMYEKISHLEKKSYLTCEICGADGNLRKNTVTGYLKTMCTSCTEKNGPHVSASVSI